MEISYRTQSIRGWMMRIFLIPSVLIIVSGGLLGVTKASEAQKNQLSEVNLSLYLNDVSVMYVLQAIEEETEFTFAFNYEQLNLDKVVSVEAQNKSVEEILHQVFRNTNVTWGLSGNVVLLKVWDDPEHTIENEPAPFQQTITGRVIDAQTGEALPGVNVIVAGSDEETGSIIGTQTDLDGNYSINVPEELNTLAFTYIGYQRLEVAIDGRSEINIQLQQDIQMLDDVVVVGYGVVAQRDLTGSVSSIRAEQLNTTAQSDVGMMLQGRAPGVQITQTSAEPGGGTSIRIRGARSITAGNEPLYVIDGLPGAPMNSISPTDIESIEILKDASATAIYGSRGANGVILITTKRGQDGGMQISYNGELGYQSIVKKLDLMNAQEYMGFINDVSRDLGNAPVFSESEISSVGMGTDWQDEIFQTAPMQTHQLSFSGGSEDTRYYLSLNQMNQEGIVINTDFERYGARLNVDHTLNRFNFGINLNTSQEQDSSVPMGGNNRDAGVFPAALQMDPTLPVFNEDGTYYTSAQHDLDNPLAQAETIHNNAKINRTFGNFYVEYNVLDNLSARVNFGSDRRSLRRDIFISNATKRGQLLNGSATIQQQENSNNLVEFTLNYDNQLHENHQINAVVGYTYQEFINRSHNSSAENFPTEAFGTDNLSAGDPTRSQANSGRSQNQLLSWLGRINYSFFDKYLVTATYRVDGSSRFGENHKYGFFPSLALAWRLSDEVFISDLDFFSDLKLRMSYGATGNQEIGNNQSLILLGSGPEAVLNGQLRSSIVPNQLGNPELRWESTRQFNTGLDFGFLEDRITGSIDYFISNTNDLLLNLPIPRTSGFTNSLQNVGDTKNKGFEFQIRSRNIVGGFNWSTTFNFATLKNEVTNLGDLPFILQGGARFLSNMTIIEVGKPLNTYYGYKVEGIFQHQDEIDGSAQTDANPGDLIFKDVDGDGQITANDRVNLGNPFPDYTLGLHNSFALKGFALDVFLEGRFGFELANVTRLDTELPLEFLRNRQRFALDRWTPDNPTNEHPSFTNQDLTRAMNSRIVEDASFLRLKNVRLSYTVPDIEFVGINSLSVYLSATNLFTITNYSGMNPDVNTQGTANVRMDYSAYPLAKIFALGINVRI